MEEEIVEESVRKADEKKPSPGADKKPSPKKSEDVNLSVTLENKPEDPPKKKSSVSEDKTVVQKKPKTPPKAAEEQSASLTVTKSPDDIPTIQTPTIIAEEVDEQPHLAVPKHVVDDDDDESPMQKYLDELFGGGDTSGGDQVV